MFVPNFIQIRSIVLRERVMNIHLYILTNFHIYNISISIWLSSLVNLIIWYPYLYTFCSTTCDLSQKVEVIQLPAVPNGVLKTKSPTCPPVVVHPLSCLRVSHLEALFTLLCWHFIWYICISSIIQNIPYYYRNKMHIVLPI